MGCVCLPLGVCGQEGEETGGEVRAKGGTEQCVILGGAATQHRQVRLKLRDGVPIIAWLLRCRRSVARAIRRSTRGSNNAVNGAPSAVLATTPLATLWQHSGLAVALWRVPRLQLRVHHTSSCAALSAVRRLPFWRLHLRLCCDCSLLGRRCRQLHCRPCCKLCPRVSVSRLQYAID